MREKRRLLAAGASGGLLHGCAVKALARMKRSLGSLMCGEGTRERSGGSNFHSEELLERKAGFSTISELMCAFFG